MAPAGLEFIVYKWLGQRPSNQLLQTKSILSILSQCLNG